MDSKYKKLFESINIGGCKIKNRFVMAPMGPMGLGDFEGGFSQRGIDYYVERAKGGTGLITTGVCLVDTEIEKMKMPSVPNPNYNPIHFIRQGKEMTERIHAYGSKVFIQLSGGFGRVIPIEVMGFTVAPSPVMNRWEDVLCRELTIEEVENLVKEFGTAAEACKRAGFDGIQIHAVHEGYLIDQFAMSLFNKRTDKYGGGLENRLRLSREIVEEIKKACGKEFPVTLRFSPKSFIKNLRDGALPGEKFVEKGRDLEEGIEAAKLLVEYGYDALDVDVGSYDSWWWSHPPMYQAKGLYRPYARIVKKAVNVPVICAGRMDDPDMAVEAVLDGTTDMIGLGRPLLADPDYVIKLRRGEKNSIRPCISCQEGCMGRMQKYMMVNCAVNPQAGRERVNAYNTIMKPKKIMIIGGGVGGCEAARVLATRGHKPELFEKSDRLGGKLIAAGVPDFKEDDIALINWYIHSLEELEVPIHLKTEISSEDVLKYDADVVIVATGAVSKMIEFSDKDNVFSAEDVLMKRLEVGQKTVVVGGGLVGCETALWLADEGKDVTIVEALDGLLAANGPSCSANSEMLKKLVPFKGIDIKVNAMVKDYKDGILIINTAGGYEKIECDSLIISVGFKSDDSLYQLLEEEVDEIYNIGDSRVTSNVMYAIWDAYEVANHI